MSATGSYSSDRTDSYTNGLNPMYQSLSTHTQSEYDVITESQSCLISPQPPVPSRVTTTNAIYATKSESLRHPTLKNHSTMNSKPEDFRFTTFPETKRLEEGKDGNCESQCVTSFVCLVSSLSILLSVGVIVLCVLHSTDVVSIVSPPSAVSSSSNSSNNSSSTQFPNTTNNASDMFCNCTNGVNYTTYLQIIEGLDQDLNNLTLEYMFLETMVPSTRVEMELRLAELSRDSKRLNRLLSRVQSIGDSIQRLRVQATNTCSVLSAQQSITKPVELDNLGNQTCPPNTTNLNRPADVTIDIGEECTIRRGTICTTSPNLACITVNVVDFIEDNRVLMDFFCYLDSQTLSVINGTAAIRQDSLVNTSPGQDIYSSITSATHVIGCWCLSYEDAESSCRYFAKHCNYKETTINSTITII